MKKSKGYMFILISAILLSGCVKNDVKMTDEQVDRTAEYAAGVLLKYDKNYESTLIEETENPLKTSSPAPTNNGNSQKPQVTPIQSALVVTDPSAAPVQGNNEQTQQKLKLVSLAGVFQLKDCEINFSKMKVLDSYEQQKSAYIKAEKGKKLVILEFKIKNTSTSEQKVKLQNQNISYKLQIKDKGEYQPNVTIFVNDLQFYNKTIKKEKADKGILIFSVSEDEAKSSMELQVSRKNEIAQIKIK